MAVSSSGAVFSHNYRQLSYLLILQADGFKSTFHTLYNLQSYKVGQLQKFIFPSLTWRQKKIITQRALLMKGFELIQDSHS